jgi:hypothetical protein
MLEVCVAVVLRTPRGRVVSCLRWERWLPAGTAVPRYRSSLYYLFR